MVFGLRLLVFKVVSSPANRTEGMKKLHNIFDLVPFLCNWFFRGVDFGRLLSDTKLAKNVVQLIFCSNSARDLSKIM
jgi:hypothetical protein